MFETIELRLSDAAKTEFAGKSLASTIYGLPVDIHVSGEVGAGKTTFIRGFASGLGIFEPVTSPTFALEQRYATMLGAPFFHIDCYRLSPVHAADFLRSTDVHDGIRCIEWPERAGAANEHAIGIHLSEDGDGRLLTCRFGDVAFPDDALIDAWRNEVLLPKNVCEHCDKVADVAMTLADHLLAHGRIIRRETLRACGRLHDLIRYLDFKTDPPDTSPETLTVWKQWREQYRDVRHEDACARFLRERGYAAALPEIIEVHGLSLPSPPRRTVEQQLLYYADKRVAMDQIVGLKERFDDFQRRYAGSEKTKEGDIWYAEALGVERELFPEGIPML